MLEARSPSIFVSLRVLCAGLLLGLITLTAAFYRDFAYLYLPLGPVKLYVTEVVLILVLTLLAAAGITTGIVRVRLGVAAVPVILFCLTGVLALVRGRGWGILSVREFATNYYSILYLLIPIVFLSQRASRWLAKGILVGTAIASCIVLLRIFMGIGTITSTGSVRYHPSIGIGASFALYWFLGAPASTPVKRTWHTLGAVACVLLIVVATQHRSAIVAIAGSLLLWLAILHKGRGPGAIGTPGLTLVTVLMAALFVLLNSHIAAPTLDRFRALIQSSEDPNSAWRLYSWGLMIAGIAQAPLLGHGFGGNLPSFLFHGQAYGLDPTVPIGAHNSYLFLLFKEGIIGFGLAVAFAASVFAFCLPRVHRNDSGEDRWIAGAAIGAFSFVCLFAAFNVVLEGPYMGMFFWIYPALAEAILRNGSRTDAPLETVGASLVPA